MKNIFNTSLRLCLCFILLLNNASAQDKPAKIDSLILRANRHGLFNGNVVVADNGKIIYKATIGFADASGKTFLTPQYRFHIGSIAKEFNAVAIMMLQEQGKLNLNDKINKYLPGLPPWANQISIQNLLQYTSGLPDVKWQTVKNDADNMADIKRITKLDFEPGTNYAYNNNNVFLQRRIVESITGMSFKQFVEQKILKPCGMNTAIVDPTDNDTLIARSYNNNRKQDALVYPISGWTCVTLGDFYKWTRVIANFSLISPAATRAILIPVGPNKQAGLGGGTMEGDKLITHIHDGTSLNYQALQVTNTAQGRTVILMTNNKNVSLYDFNSAIQNILDGKPYHEPKKAILDAYQKQLDTLSGKKIIAFYQKLKITNAYDFGFDDEATLNTIGYYLIGKQRIGDAIVVFEYNTALFPQSGNVFDSLAEAYYKQGNKPKALLNYKRLLQLDPTNQTAKDVIAELGK
ncbi:tetratricopeptide repeat protein [Mucilaginibacter gracilis]|uniref:Tetratricopeptide repeat protein n=1 Tax=Mucilaginibacter gracilis TaxID=423350 RepID=A0A495J304_9SPHI|nr:serine hydrolase [Mucilaginibacter gracilis]RKR82748.1 tetratricopeptide repeat protein [Mucilaginibacter gracilis]